MDLSKLKEPFPAEDIEWRLQQADKGKNGIWGKCLAYVTNRAICNRLDEVCGPENWKNEFDKAPDGGVLCGISIKIGDEWVTKWDGAENTNIEAVKGGLSSAMKRAASTGWGIGRYLYNLEESWVEVNEKGKYSGKTKSGEWFRWDPPTLSAWALPGGSGKPDSKSANSQKPKNNEPVDDSELIRQTTILESWINDGDVLTGEFLKKAQMYINTKDLDGIKRTIEYCKSKKSA